MWGLKCVIVGDDTVGKTCLLVSYTTNEFPTDYVPRVADNYSVDVIVNDNKSIRVGMWDTVGHEDYDRVRPLSYPQTDIFLVCFSIISRSSFESVKTKWVPEIQHYMPYTPFLIVGTKLDLRNDSEYDAENPINCGEGVRLAMQLDAKAYVECSALTQEGLKDVVNTGYAFCLLFIILCYTIV